MTDPPTRDDVKAMEKQIKKETKEKMRKYSRGNEAGEMQPRYKAEVDQPDRLKAKLKNAKRMKEEAIKSAAKTEMIHDSVPKGFIELDEGEDARKITQRDIVEQADFQTKRKAFELYLPKLGPYLPSYAPNGNMLGLVGEKGHLSFFHWKKFKLFGEVNLKDRVHDVHFLHDDQLCAVAQKKYTYIYNNKGAEIHILKTLQEIKRIDFLRHHMLLTAVGKHGVLHYFDVSIGRSVGVHKTKLGPCSVMKHNPWNGVVSLGHTHGTVTLWAPKSSAPLVKLLGHQAPLVDIAYPLDGRYMVTAGADSQVKVWDTRTWKEVRKLHQKSMPSSMDISQSGLLSISSKNKVEIWRDWTLPDTKAPYLTHTNRSNQDIISKVRFCPYEDVLGIAHANGFKNILVPGAGEANYDYYVDNPYETQRQRMERPVHQLLDKLAPEMIMLNPRSIGRIDTRKVREKRQLKQLSERQQEYEKDKNKSGVSEGDIDSSDVEAAIIRPEVEDATRKPKAVIKRPKHLKEKKLYLQKQEHQRWKAKQEAKRNREAHASGGEVPTEETAGGEQQESEVETPRKLKRRKKVAPRKLDALEMFRTKKDAHAREIRLTSRR